MMGNEKFYYAALVLLCAVSMLLSPFFFVSRGKRPPPAAALRWRTIAAVNLLTALTLAAVWYFWLRGR